ncbi:UNVERIFIED_CONTAM: hypothetical protein K2H54_010757, partial [Gekko kuhli]
MQPERGPHTPPQTDSTEGRHLKKRSNASVRNPGQLPRGSELCVTRHGRKRLEGTHLFAGVDVAFVPVAVQETSTFAQGGQ